MENILNDYKTKKIMKQDYNLVTTIYEALGYTIESKSLRTIKFKRPRRISNKDKLLEMEKEFDDCLDKINNLENGRKKKILVFQIIFYIIGTLTFGGGLSIGLVLENYFLSVPVGLLGIIILLMSVFIGINKRKKNDFKIKDTIEREKDRLEIIIDTILGDINDNRSE